MREVSVRKYCSKCASAYWKVHRSSVEKKSAPPKKSSTPISSKTVSNYASLVRSSLPKDTTNQARVLSNIIKNSSNIFKTCRKELFPENSTKLELVAEIYKNIRKSKPKSTPTYKLAAELVKMVPDISVRTMRKVLGLRYNVAKRVKEGISVLGQKIIC